MSSDHHTPSLKISNAALTKGEVDTQVGKNCIDPIVLSNHLRSPLALISFPFFPHHVFPQFLVLTSPLSSLITVSPLSPHYPSFSHLFPLRLPFPLTISFHYIPFSPFPHCLPAISHRISPSPVGSFSRLTTLFSSLSIEPQLSSYHSLSLRLLFPLSTHCLPSISHRHSFLIFSLYLIRHSPFRLVIRFFFLLLPFSLFPLLLCSVFLPCHT